jgi:anti-sigma factor RsiW
MSAAIDGELSSKELEELKDHIDGCSECQIEFQDAKNTKNILRERIVRVRAPKNLVDSILRMTTVTT